ncbi:MAG: CRISPR-associated protein Cas4 [Euryarchaeota archaeon RBG_13_57_23]|nr:MAG: CRISPR-associated protein Cas4 [Euryarchaeota archaeon RBG_16_62_10]OGS45185.1 MAG: CRISPR-associated protein Cas4 [Euryarchaeota archaeon RBG_13_57_23]
MARVQTRYISASDVEKYSYCPLSWWLSAEYDGESEEIAQGVKGHEKLGKLLWDIDAKEKAARQAEKLVFWWAIGATFLAIIGLEVTPFENAVTLSQVLGVVSLIWVLASLFFLYKATRSRMHGTAVNYEKLMLVFSMVAVIVAVSAVAFLITDVRLAEALEAAALVWLIGAAFFLYRSLRSTEIVESLRREFRVTGKIEYIDFDRSKAFKSEKYGLSGRPDYVIKIEDNLIPVEEKTGRTPQGPLFSHILQVAAYCLLIEETEGKAPPYGLLKYPQHEHDIEYNEDLRRILLEKLAEMRAAVEKADVHRNHNRPGKCKYCSRRSVCPEKLG